MPKKGHKPSPPQISQEEAQERQIQALKQTVSTYDKQMIAMQNQIVEEQAKFDKIRQNAEKSEEILDQLKSAYEQQLQNEITDLTPEIKQGIEEQEAKKQQAQELYDKLRTQKTQHLQVIKRVEDTIAQLSQQNAELRQEKSQNQVKARALEQRTEGMLQTRRMMVSMTEEIHNLKATIDCYQSLIEKRKNEDLEARENDAAAQLEYLTKLREEKFKAVSELYNTRCGQSASRWDCMEQLLAAHESEQNVETTCSTECQCDVQPEAETAVTELEAGLDTEKNERESENVNSCAEAGLATAFSENTNDDKSGDQPE